MPKNYLVIKNEIHTLSNNSLVVLMTTVLSRGIPFRFTASGQSMTPFICNNDLITCESPPFHLYIGDVVAFIHPDHGNLIVHRVVKLEKTQRYLIRGDNAFEPDGNIEHANILARIICVERNGRRVKIGLGSERIIIAFLSLHGLILPIFTPIQWVTTKYHRRCVK